MRNEHVHDQSADEILGSASASASASVAAGDDASGAGFPATTGLRVELRSTPVQLGTPTTDATGESERP